MYNLADLPIDVINRIEVNTLRPVRWVLCTGDNHLFYSDKQSWDDLAMRSLVQPEQISLSILPFSVSAVLLLPLAHAPYVFVPPCDASVFAYTRFTSVPGHASVWRSSTFGALTEKNRYLVRVSLRGIRVLHQKRSDPFLLD